MSNDHNDLEALVTRGEELVHEGRITDAETVFAQVLEVDPEHPAVLHFLGYQASQKKEYPEAEALFRRVIARAPDNVHSLFGLAMSLYAQNKFGEAAEFLDRAKDADPNQPHVWLYRGVMLESLDRKPEAVLSYVRGLTGVGKLGWAPTEPETQRLVDHARTIAALELDRRFDEALKPLVEAHGDDAISRIRKGADGFVGKASLQIANSASRPGLFYIPDLEPQRFYERSEFDWVPGLEGAVDTIKEELMAMADGGADVLLYKHGVREEHNCSRCPETMKLIEGLDLHRIEGYAPQVMVSVMPAGAEIPPRHGPVNGRVIVHLPLSVPQSGMKLVVGEEGREWKEGEALLFDDTFLHSARNEGDTPLVVLIFDVWNPQLSKPEREALSIVLRTAQAFERMAD